MPNFPSLTLPLLSFASLVALVSLGIACDPQADSDYMGEPLGRVAGEVAGEAPALPGDPEVAILWFRGTEDAECTGPGLSCGYSVLASFDVDVGCLQACEEMAPAECTPEGYAALAPCFEACGGTFEQDTSWGLCTTGAIGSKVAVTGAFPAKFALDLLEPPPAEALLVSQIGGAAVALGWILVVSPDAPLAFDFADESIWEDDGGSGILGVAPSHLLMYAAGPVTADSPWGQILGGSFETGYHLVEASGGECEIDADGDKVCESTTLMPAPDDLETEVGVTLAPISELQFPIPDAE